MAKTKEAPRFEDFAYRGPDLDTVTEEAVSARHDRLWVPTGYSSDGGEQQLLVTRTLPSAENHTRKTPIVRGTAFSDEPSRPENKRFDYAIAEATGRAVYSVHAPGVHYAPWRRDRDDAKFDLTPDQKENLQEGSFRKVGDAALIAVELAHEMLDPDNDEGFIFSGSSQGAAMLAGGLPAAVRRNTPVKAVVFSEIVNNTERDLVSLHRQPPFIGGLAEEFVKANEYAQGYLDQNPKLVRESVESPLFWARRVVNNAGANLAHARALAMGKFENDLDDETLRRLAQDEQATQMVVTRGGESLLAREGAHAGVVVRMGKKGLDVVDITYPTHTHPYTMTVHSIAGPVNQLKDVA